MLFLLDVIGSNIIGGTLLIIALTLLNTSTKYFYSHSDDLIVQQNLTSITHTLEYDLKKMGFGLPENEQVIKQADSTHISYLGDIDRDGTADTLEFYVGPYSELSHTQNPNDRFLYRKINSSPSAGFMMGVVTEFKFDYLDQDGILLDTSIPGNMLAIKMIRITLQVENTSVYGNDPNPQADEYRTAFWQQTRLVSRNLRR
ncbi:MAG: hypothetical protein WAN36_04935 [Calditrichia bacterium]